MAGLKQIMEIFMTINQPLSSEQRVRWYKQRKVLRENDKFLITLPKGYGYSPGVKVSCVATKPKEATHNVRLHASPARKIFLR